MADISIERGTPMPDNTTVLRKLKHLLQQHFPDAIRDIILFGSSAKGAARDDSDYDVLIVLNNNDYDWKFRDEVTDVVYDLELADDILVDKHLISVDELEHSLRGAQPTGQRDNRGSQNYDEVSSSNQPDVLWYLLCITCAWVEISVRNLKT